MMTILEYMESLGIIYIEPNTAWRDFWKLCAALPEASRPSRVRMGDKCRWLVIA